MPTPNGFIGLGTTLKINSNLVGGLTDISIPETTADIIDITSHSSSSGFKEKILGLKDTADLSFTANFIKGDVGQVYVRTNQGASTTFEIALPNGVKWTGSCILNGCSGSIPVDGKVTFTFKLAISGSVALAEA